MTRVKRGVIAPIVIGIVGTAILLGLCAWQLQRLAWKEGLIETLEARLSAPPSALPETPDPAADEFTRVTVTGRFLAAPGAHGFPDAPFLTTYEKEGAGYRIIQPLTLTDGSRIMVSRGWVPLAEKNRGGAASLPTAAPEGEIEITGALRWPDETADPPFGKSDNVWIARDLDEMARLFDARPILVVAETSTAPEGARWPVPVPLGIDLPNNHLNYAITWGLLALVWAVMSVLWARRELRRA